MRRRQSRAWWTAVVRKFQGSGLSHGEFAARHRLNLGTLRHWIYQCRKDSSIVESAKEAPTLLPVRVVRSPALIARGQGASESLIEVELRDGVRLRFPTVADLRYVSSLIQSLR